MKTTRIVKSTATTLLFLVAITGFSALSHIPVIGHQYAYAGSADMPDWMTGTDDAEDKVTSMGEKIFKLIVVVAAVFGAIGFIWGLGEMNGVIGEAERGPSRIKKGLFTIAIAATAYPLIGFFAGLAK